ncbi:MAG: CCA tRNA nucleotidyltransferase [Baekduiaceae bacterium]
MADVLAELEEVPGGAHLRRAAAACAAPAYLVGGAVRDLLLGRPPRELDVAVEGDPEPLIAAIGGDVERHERFGTAVVRGDGWCVDVARCRRETYAHPGALPDVSPADVRSDLQRRDATINAIAVGLADGAVVAAPHAEADLRAGLLRVLHDASFLDDPTRLWRLARYRARLGFELEPHTAALAAQAVSGGALTTISGVRTGNELRLALREDDPVAALRSVAELGLAPWLEVDVERIAAARALAPADARGDLVTLAAALAPETDGARLQDLGFPGAERDAVLRALEVRAGRHRPAGARPSEIARAFRGLPGEAGALAPEEARAAARRWLDELRHVRLEVDGDDLLTAGVARGPEVGARLRTVLDAVLDGEVAPERSAQLAAALADDPVAHRKDRRAEP